MADTKQGAAAAPVEGDGVSYGGIVWFVVILTVTTVVCQILMWVLLRTFQYRSDAPVLSPVAAAVGERQAIEGRVYPDVNAVGANAAQITRQTFALERHVDERRQSRYRIHAACRFRKAANQLNRKRRQRTPR